MLILEADWLVLPGGKLQKGPIWVSVEGQKIAGVFQKRPPPTTDHTLLHAHLVTPGFVDIHTHGVGKGEIELSVCIYGSFTGFFLFAIVGGSDDILEYWLHPGNQSVEEKSVMYCSQDPSLLCKGSGSETLRAV